MIFASHISQLCVILLVKITALVCHRKFAFVPMGFPVKDARGVRLGTALNVCCDIFFQRNVICTRTLNEESDLPINLDVHRNFEKQ